MKKFGILIMVFLFVFMLSALGFSKTITLRLGHAVVETHPYHLGAVKFAELIKERTNGQIQIKIFPNHILGNERDMVEGLQLGTIDMVVTSTGPIGGFAPKMMAVDFPFIFRNREHAYKVLDGDIGKLLLSDLEKVGIKGLAFWENGFRNITNSKRPINKPEDLKGIKIRVMENKVHIASFKALGANPTPMAWSEVFTALQQGTIDAQENPIPIIYNFKLYEVQKYLSMTQHFYSPALLLMSKTKFASLPKKTQEIFVKTAIEVATYERNLIKEQEDKQIGLLKEKGMIINYPDREPFRLATKKVYDEFKDKVGADIINAILNTK